MSRTQTPREAVAEMSEDEKDHLLRRVARETDDDVISRVCELAAHSKEDTIS